MPDNPNEIDITLSLLGAQAGQSFDKFVEQVGAIQTSMAAMVETNAKLQAQMNGQTSANFGEAGPNASRDSGSGGGGQEDHSSRSDGPEMHPLEDFIRNKLPPGGGAILDAFQGKRLSDFQRQTINDQFPNIKPLEVFGRNGPGEGVSMGDKLSIAAWRAGEGVKKASQNLPAGGAASGIGSLGQWAAAHPFEAYYGYNALKGFVGRHTPDTSPMLEGSALGYGRGPNDFVNGPFGTGFQIPFIGRYLSEAGRHGIEERLNRFSMRAQPGINGEQAAAIQGSLYQQGLTGGDYRGRAEDAMVRLTQRYPGIDQNLTGQMLVQGTKYGTTNLEDLANTIEGLGDAAKGSTMTMQQLQEAVDQSAQTLQSTIGGSYGDNARRSSQWFQTTGTSPAVMTGLAQTPFVQAMTLSQTGLPSWAQGLLPGNSANSMTTRSVVDLVNNLKTGDQNITDPTTGFTTRVSGTEYGINQAAQMLGRSPDEISQLYRNSQTTLAADTAESYLDRYQDQAGVLDKSGQHDAAKALTTGGPRIHDNTATWNEVRDRARAIKGTNGKPLISQKELDDIAKDVRPGHGTHNIIHETLHNAFGIGEGDHNLTAKEAAAERAKRVRKLIQERVKDQVNDQGGKDSSDTNVTIDLTDDARKLITAKASRTNNKTEKSKAQGGSSSLLDQIDTKSLLNPGRSPMAGP